MCRREKKRHANGALYVGAIGLPPVGHRVRITDVCQEVDGSRSLANDPGARDRQ